MAATGKLEVFVAGPLWREGTKDAPALHDFYGRLQVEGERAGASVQIPYENKALALLDATSFTDEITRRIRNADAMLAVLLEPSGSRDFTNVSIGWETQVAAQAGKRVCIVAKDPRHVPRVLRAFSGDRHVYAIANLDYQRLFKDLASPPERDRLSSV